jgi:hypothetical protein
MICLIQADVTKLVFLRIETDMLVNHLELWDFHLFGFMLLSIQCEYL